MTNSLQSWVEERVRETFHRLPLLEGITFDDDLALADVELAHWGRHWSPHEQREVTIELIALIDDLDGVDAAAAFLKGRTFARNVH